MNIQKLIIEDVRCFAGRQEFNIRPLTFLAGENSTGKSTVLGCLETLTTFMRSRPDGLDFNIEPYQMGAFADIVRRSNPKKKRFQIGFSFQSDKGSMEYILKCVERTKGSEPVVLEERFIFENREIICKEVERLPHHSDDAIFSSDSVDIRLGETDGIQKFEVSVIPFSIGIAAFETLGQLRFWMRRQDKNRDRSEPLPGEVQFRELLELVHQAGLSSFGTHSFAPIRSKPQRTYNPLKEAVSAEGSDMPMLLMNMSKASKQQWQELRNRLIEFGKASGLFGDINVRQLGKSTSDPFQLQIKVKGPKVNLMDVGYGVNQLLSILVRILNEPQMTTFLMQQPEVHLHPRGQAELSSLLVDLARQMEHKFIIETHSDSMINRARIEIMNKRMAPEDVSLIYLEPVGNKVMVHNIRFDEQANLLDAPNGYRDFFLHESDKLLGFIKG